MLLPQGNWDAIPPESTISRNLRMSWWVCQRRERAGRTEEGRPHGISQKNRKEEDVSSFRKTYPTHLLSHYKRLGHGGRPENLPKSTSQTGFHVTMGSGLCWPPMVSVPLPSREAWGRCRLWTGGPSSQAGCVFSPTQTPNGYKSPVQQRDLEPWNPQKRKASAREVVTPHEGALHPKYKYPHNPLPDNTKGGFLGLVATFMDIQWVLRTFFSMWNIPKHHKNV